MKPRRVKKRNKPERLKIAIRQIAKEHQNQSLTI
jgi:hypothetical protein